MLEIGKKAPDFTLLDENNNEVSLKDFLGKKVIMYFYQRDDTPGCTKQALGFKEYYKYFDDKNTVIIGVSKDTSKSHLKFKEKYDLPFILLSDPEHKVIELYDEWKQKYLYGRPYMGAVRTTFVIDENGILVDIQEKVKPDTNACELAKKF